MNTKDAVKQVVTLVVSVGVGMIVSNGIAATTPAGLSAVSKALVVVGKVATSNMLADRVADYAGNEIDKVFDALDAFKLKKK